MKCFDVRAPKGSLVLSYVYYYTDTLLCLVISHVFRGPNGVDWRQDSFETIPDEYRGYFYDIDEIAIITGLNVDQLAPVLGAKANSKSWPEIYI